MDYKEFIFQYALGTLDRYTLLNIADSIHTDEKILTILSKDKDSIVRGNIAINPNTPIEILKELSKDESRCARRPAADTLKYFKS